MDSPPLLWGEQMENSIYWTGCGDCAAAELALEGISVVGGNGLLEQDVKNSLKILELLDRSCLNELYVRLLEN